MGKKLKVGKSRKDKFYHLAKETGYRSRSSFKLIQLNRKFQFLQKARALIDLCAAPENVFKKFLVLSGVDLVPIRPIPNVVALQEDITTDKCRQALRKELQTWKVDVVLNDGAPNVGANWQYDAFSQAHLTLMALKLACEFLTKGGTFVTKVFRSKDYQPLLWIFQQFFKKVQATKPQASRNESAEIFVICQSFVAPDKIDNKFFDPKYAFKEVEVQAKTVRELIPVKKPKAEGYTDGDLTLYHSFNVTAFLRADNISIDNEELESHPATSDEVKECCRDIKVLGRKELRLLLNWRSKLRKYLAKKLKTEAKQPDPEIKLSSDEEGGNSDEEPDKKKAAQQEEEDEEAEMETKLAELKAEEVAELKRKKRKLLKERRKQRERVELKMDLPGVSIADTGDSSMFSLSTINKQKVLADISKGDMQAADALVEGDDDIHLSEEDDDEADKMSLASDLDDEDLEEVEQRLKEQSLQSFKNFHIYASTSCFYVILWMLVGKKARILDAEGLALGCEIATSKKRARDLVDGSFHRFASSEEQWDVPEWFVDDERKHRKKPVPVTKEMVEEFKQKWKEIDARPIKRVAEAKARKKRRMLKKMEQAKKKAEAVVNTVDISEREKMAQLKSIYKKAGVGKEKREVTYVVTKKGAGKKVRRPAGVKGAFKVVDSRMKKDMRGMQRKEQRAKGGKGKGGKGRGGPSRGGKGGMKSGRGRK
uniref:pre-rRNA processing protein FTSJ3 n=1 Tax=Dicentrarchus labrax TaxID=13489 RepID=A0A8C4IWH2_DICLA